MSDSDCDWFDKDEETLLRDVHKTVKKKQEQQELTTEHIKTTSSIDDYITELSIKAAQQAGADANKTNKVKITFLRKMASMNPMDLLLNILTAEYDFYSEQIYLSDSQEKVILYTAILDEICRLEVPEFRNDVLTTIAYEENLQQQYRLLLAKLVSKKFKDMWLKENEMLQFLKNMETLILKSYKIHRETEKINLLLRDLLSILNRADNPAISTKKFFNQLKANISHALETAKIPEEDIDIYPTLEDLKKEKVFPNPPDDKPSTSQQTDQEYLAKHMQFLKQDFFLSLKDCFDILKNKPSRTQLPNNILFFDDVSIVLNEKYLDAYRHELVFVDTLGSKRKRNIAEGGSPFAVREVIKKIKTGALLCFTTSYSFENLILATVTFTTQDCFKEGYIGIEIARQYNIGNIYDQKLIMFESPAFFEPYNNVFNYLKNCGISSFPLKKYFVNGEVPDKQIPKYLNSQSKYYCYGKAFKPLTEEAPKNLSDLNELQLKAFRKALIQEVALIQGPPGTGKTHLSAQIVKTLMENTNNTPLVLITYTNDSLDKFLVKISQFTNKILRFGSQTRDTAIAKYNAKDSVEHPSINSKLKKLYYTINAEYKQKFQNLQKKHKDFDNTEDAYQEILKAQYELAEVKEKLVNIKIMFHYYAAKDKWLIALTSTCAAKMNFLFRLLKSNIVIFEEAAEIVESHVVACLTPYTQHIIMIGDHLQLQPFGSSYQLAPDMNVSFFEKTLKMQKYPMQLKIQYRMHPKIAELLSNTIYDSLESDFSVTQYPPVRKMMTNLFFMSHSMNEGRSQNDDSVYNTYEVEEIVKLALHLVEVAKYDTHEIHILSPYAKQVEFIKRQLAKLPPLIQLKVSTVDSFQGLESKIILLSLVRSNKISQIGFLKQTNRVCVALSRAKYAMYIIGNLPLLSECSPTWSQIQEKLTKINAVGSKFPIELEAETED